MKLSEILLKPMITERSLKMAKNSVYAFYAARLATKHQIAAAAKTLFGVTVDGVKTAIRKGKVRKRGKRMVRRQLSDYKIAYIHVKGGKIDLFPQA